MQCLAKEASNCKFSGRSFFMSLMIGFLLLSSGFKKEEHLNMYSLTGLAQGTTYHISYYAPTSKITKVQIDSIINKIDSSMSVYKPYSLISAFNKAQTRVTMDYHFKKVIEKSLEISKKSNGAFDITVYPLVSAWGFGPVKTKNLPDSNQIKSILENVGYQHLKIKDNQLLKDKPSVKIDVNGIAQGYSVDLIASFLEGKGIHRFIVELGGELIVKGKKPKNEFFKVGIEAVNAEDFSPVKKYIEIDRGAVTTSGSYRKFHQAGGKKVNHLIDPKTGYYLQNELISVTIYAKNAITADGFDNVLMGLGLKKAMSFLAKEKDLEAYLVYTENGVVKDTCSAGFPKIQKF
ncbi:MAG TPA: FAD:protein FMN transferase [Pelobium sp.]|nr:FAD:protein FMN transferase [Pelobium sp.]